MKLFLEKFPLNFSQLSLNPKNVEHHNAPVQQQPAASAAR